eukprot:26057-Chlamydomonas_euryale.AAC.2
MPRVCSLLQVELHSLGMMKTLPYVTMFVMSNVGGWAGDWFIHRLKMSVRGAEAATSMRVWGV